MYKIKNITFNNHPILGSISLDFTDINGNAVDTIIIAGENGTGKSTILQELFNIVTGSFNAEMTFTLVDDVSKEHIIQTTMYKNQFSSGYTYNELHGNDGNGVHIPNSSFDIGSLRGIYSDVDIVFAGNSVSSVTSMDIDNNNNSERSTQNLPIIISQLLVDIDTMDNSDLARAYRNAIDEGKDTNSLSLNPRMKRFTSAFDKMFKDIHFDRIDNSNGVKVIIFKKGGVDIPLDSLSSGEKQIVYRGAFLLKNVDALRGVTVFIDEPEISMHPEWQKRIMDFYKSIFTDEKGKQTSQIFIATHSPFIIHNEYRYNDKVIVLKRNRKGFIVVDERPEYYSCESLKAIEDAFSIYEFSRASTVYVEGITDEKYFKRAKQLFGENNYAFDIVSIGNETKSGSKNCGYKSLNNAYGFLTSQRWPIPTILLYDCDTGISNEYNGNVNKYMMPHYENKRFDNGIENALIIDESFNLDDFYDEETKNLGDGGKITKTVLRKNQLCDYICKLPETQLREVFGNIKEILDTINILFNNANSNN